MAACIIHSKRNSQIHIPHFGMVLTVRSYGLEWRAAQELTGSWAVLNEAEALKQCSAVQCSESVDLIATPTHQHTTNIHSPTHTTNKLASNAASDRHATLCCQLPVATTVHVVSCVVCRVSCVVCRVSCVVCFVILVHAWRRSALRPSPPFVTTTDVYVCVSVCRNASTPSTGSFSE